MGLGAEISFKMQGIPLEQIYVNLYNLAGTLQIGIDSRRRRRRQGGGTVALWKVAFIMEYGNPNNRLFGHPAPIPARPAINTMWRQRGDSYLRSLRMYAFMAAQGKFPLAQGMDRLGHRIKKDAEIAYQLWREPANRQYTIQHKRQKVRGNDPLMDTGLLSKAWDATWVPDHGGPKSALKAARKVDSLLKKMARDNRR